MKPVGEARKIYSGFVLNSPLHASKKVKKVLENIEKTVSMTNDQYFDVRVILSELLQNAIRHGSTTKRFKKVYINVRIGGDHMLIITVKDPGRGFDAHKVLQEELKRKSTHISDLFECGRGLQIVKSLCDNMVFSHDGNCITVKKKLV